MLKMLRAACLMVLLGGCSLGQPIARQAIDYNAAVETSANSLLLRNILRARDEMPLHFTTIPQIRGSMNLGLGQPGLLVPTAGGAGSVLGLGLSGGVSPSFDVSALDTQEFIRGLLEPLEPQIFRYYLERGYPEEMLLLLLFSSIEQPGVGLRIPNDPRCWLDQPDCPVAASGAAIVATLRATAGQGRFVFHDYTRLEPLGGTLSAAQATQADLLGVVAEQRLRLLPLRGGRFQLYRPSQEVVACRRLIVAGRSILVPVTTTATGPQPTESAPICVQREVVVAHATEFSEDRERVLVRSVQEIIRFLGVLLRAQARLPPWPDGTPRCLTFGVLPGGDPDSGRRACLFQLYPEGATPPGGAAFSIDYEGARYQVARFREPGLQPGELGDYSVMLLALLSDLVNLKKSSAAIPSTRAVQLVR